MPEFEYRVLTEKGRVVKKVESATSEEELIESLRSQGYSILDIRALRTDGDSRYTRKRRFAIELFGVPEKSLVFFTRQFATTVVAGLPLLRALTTLQQQTSSPRLSRVLGDVVVRIQQGESLAAAMNKHQGTFSPLYLSMIRVGEVSGNLEKALTRLADMTEKDFALKRKVKGAMAYPAFVFIFSALLVYGMVAFLLPGFTPIFQHSGLDIHRDYPITALLMQVSRAATNPYVVGGVVGSMLGFLVVYRLMLRVTFGRLIIDTVIFHFPFLAGLIQLAILTRFCRTFGTLVASGLPLLECLHLVGASSGNLVVERSLRRVSEQIQSGDRISATLQRVPLFPPLLVQMVVVGEETGTLDSMFHRVADYYEQELESAVSSVTALIEPAMMIGVGGIVCFFVMGVLLPILGISSAMQNQI